MGHFRPGFSSHVVGDFIREERYSVVAAMAINGIVASHTVPNAFDTEDFNFALENFIAPSIGRFALGEPRSVVIMDNCRIHDSNETIDIIRRKGGIAVFLPYVLIYMKLMYLLCFLCFVFCQQSHLWKLSDQ